MTTTLSTESNTTKSIEEKNAILRHEFGLEIRVSEQRGRFLVACKTFYPGLFDIILVHPT
jgi:hypothetical protein